MSGVLAFQFYNWHYFFAELVNGVAVGSVYALIALGYTMVYGVLKLLNFAHGDVYMVGAYIGWFVLNALGSPLAPVMPLVPLLLLAFAASMVGCSVLGVMIERFAYRPLRKAPRIAPLITAIGVSFFLEQTAVLLWGANPRSYNTFSLRNGELFTSVGFGNLRIQYVQLVVILSTVALMLALSLFVWRTRTGKAMRAVSVDPEAASMMGIDVDRVIAVTFLLGSALAGAAGVMTGIVYQQLNPYMGFGAGLKAFIAAVVGGIGNIGGAMLGGMLIGLAETFTVGYLSSAFSDLIVFSLLVVFMLFRATGIFGSPVLQKV
ncbi:MAG TPA: branched-chain amino acid ABC transporter permease [Gaiellaceae bacterium]|jgi:branched-chain amino acid transport system permease protein|nr:branched-chain amino acid ABC transporter permease [Gaiellaceae bacterium]